MKKLLLVICLGISLSATAQQNSVIKLYREGAVESNGITADEHYDKWGSAYDISEATLTIYLPNRHTTGQMILVCPGGGYGMLAIRHEGTYVAEELNKSGVAVAVLKYRLPNGHHEIPLQDALAAMDTLRYHAASWGIEQIGVMGFSAGGHLASTLLTHYTSPTTRPDFGILIYPVVSFRDYPHQGTRRNLLKDGETNELIDLYSNELHVDDNTPPTLLVLSSDDKVVSPRHSMLFLNELCNHNIMCEMHVYPEGGHGWGYIPDALAAYRPAFNSTVSAWLSRCKKQIQR